MARLEAQARMGFFAAEPEAITELVKHLVPAGSSVFIFDPCAGEGEAIKQIAGALDVPHENVYAIELDPGRGNAIREAMPKARVLAPCSFFGASMLAGSFGLI